MTNNLFTHDVGCDFAFATNKINNVKENLDIEKRINIIENKIINAELPFDIFSNKNWTKYSHTQN